MTVTTRVIKNARRRGCVVYTRRKWGSRLLAQYQWRRVNRRHNPFPSDTLIWHITVTFDDGVLVGNFFDDMQEVERIGQQRFMSGVSYNWLIDMKTGEIGLGQSLDASGTHTVNVKNVPGYSYDQNKAGIAIAFIGMPGAKLSVAAKLSASRLVAAMMDEGVLTKGHDSEPHSLFAAKDCPTDAVRDNIEKMEKGAQALLKLNKNKK